MHRRHLPLASRLSEPGSDIVAGQPAPYAAFQESGIARWQAVLRAGRITMD